MPLIQMTAVVEGEDLDPQRLLRGITAALRVEVDEIDKLYRLFYGTWEGEKPNMIKKVSPRGRDAYAEVSTRGRTADKGNRKLLWLDDGTDHRWAVMSNPFHAKTQGGQIRSGRGQGGPVIRGKRAMQKRGMSARPGVEAKNVSDAISKERESEFQSNIDNAIDGAT